MIAVTRAGQEMMPVDSSRVNELVGVLLETQEMLSDFLGDCITKEQDYKRAKDVLARIAEALPSSSPVSGS